MFFFTSDIASSSDISTIGNLPKNKGGSSGPDANIITSKSSATHKSFDVTVSADDEASKNAPSSSTDIASTVDDQANRIVSGKSDVTTDANDKSIINEAASVGTSTSLNATSSIAISNSDEAQASTSALVKPTTVMSSTTKSTSTAVVITTSPTPIAQDCYDIADQGYTENYGIYRIQPSGDPESFEVVCDLKTDGQRWIVFQRRFDGSVDFRLPWEDYKNGFGTLTGEHWLGLEKLHWLTRNGTWQLRVDLEDFSGNTAFAEYSTFAIGSESTKYRLSVGGYAGTAGDSLTQSANYAFSTYDQDHDARSDIDCAESYKGSWWYFDCAFSNLNALYLGPSVIDKTGIVLYHWKNRFEVFKKSEMKMVSDYKHDKQSSISTNTLFVPALIVVSYICMQKIACIFSHFSNISCI